MNCPPMDVAVEKLEKALVDAFLQVFGSRLVSLVLYGSYARGDFREDSDIDVPVILDSVCDRYALHSELDKVEKALEPILKCFNSHGYYPVLSPIVLGVDEAKFVRPLYLDIVFDCRVLYDRDGFASALFDSLRRRLREYGAERVRIGKKWVTVLKKNYRFGEVIEF